MKEHQWQTVQEEAWKQVRLEREEAKENETLGYQLDTEIHNHRAEIWEEIARLLADVIHGTLLDT